MVAAYHVEIPLDGARVGSRAQPQPAEDRVGVLAVDVDFLHELESERVLGANARLDLLGTLWLLRQELVAGKCEDRKATLVKLRVQLLELRIPADRLASEGGHIDNKCDVACERAELEGVALGVRAWYVEKVGWKLRRVPLGSVVARSTDHLGHEGVCHSTQAELPRLLAGGVLRLW